jgi:hypothetical protein
MTRGDLLAVMRYTMPTRPLLDLSATEHHTESSATLCSVTDQILIRWCGANHLLQACSCPGAGGAAGIPPHGALHST